MIEDILTQVKDSLLKGAVSEYGLTEEKAKASVDVAQESILDGFKQEFSAGNVNGLLSLLQGKEDLLTNPIVLGIVSQYGGKLISQLGLSPQIADGLSKFAIPFIIKQFTQQGPEKEMNEGALVQMLGSSMGQDLMDDFKDKLPGDLGKTLGGLFG